MSDNASEIFKDLEKRLENHKRILNLGKSDGELVDKLVMTKPFLDLINTTVRIFQLGSSMEFLINSGIFSQIVEQEAIRLRRRNEKFCSNYLKILKKVEPVLWVKIIMLIQTKLMKIELV